MNCAGLAAALLGSFAFATAVRGQTNAADLAANCSAYASVPLPAEAKQVLVPTIAPDCTSYRFYRGIGRPVNYSKARACAWRERLAQNANLGQNEKDPDAWIVGGSLILADIYFNGAGVKRNIPLAMRFACESEEGMAMLALPEIKKVIASGHSQGRFEFCDYAATTVTMDFCSDYESEVEDNVKKRYYVRLKSSMNPAQREAFDKLLAAEDAYIKAHGDEVDQGGTIRGMRTIGSEAILKDLFHTELVHFERKQWPGLSSRQISIADALLRSEFKKKRQELQAQTKEAIEEGAVSAENLAKVENVWLRYRDAWVGFANVRYPGEVSRIRAEITMRRYLLLKTIYAYGS